MSGRKVGRSGASYAFEPAQDNIAVLLRNIQSNGTENVQIVAKGVGDMTTTSRFATYEKCGLVNHIITPSTPAAPDAIITEIPVVSIDDFVKRGNNRRPDFIKVDVEGHELKVLQGAVKNLERYRPIVVCEVRTELYDEIVRLMVRDLGYKLKDLGGRGRGLKTAGLSDFLFTPK